MRPVLFKIGLLNVYSVGFFLFFGVVFGLFISWRKAREYHLDDEDYFDMAFAMLFGGLISGRIWFIIEHFEQFGWNLLKWIWFTHYVGISLWGALLGGILTIFFIARNQNKDVYQLLDLASMGVSLGLFFVWIGAHLNGTLSGVVFKNLGVYYKPIAEIRFPVHFIAIIGFFCLYRLLWILEPKYRLFEWYRAGKSSAKTGFLFAFFLVGFGIISFLVSVFSESTIIWGGLKPGMLYSLISMVCGLIFLQLRSGWKLSLILKEFVGKFSRNQ